MSEWLKIVSTVLKVWLCPVSSLSHHPACVMCQMTYLLTLYYYNNKFGVKYYHDRHVHSARLIWFSCMANSKRADELKPINLLLIF